MVLDKKMRVHQNIELNGVDIGEDNSRKKSAFFNEGKWSNFIDPLLPKECQEMTLVEMGCSAGLFLRMAKEKGFKNVVGVEKSKRACLAGEEYKKQYGLEYKIINRSIDDLFDFNELPMADVTLLANIHYHIKLPDLLIYLDRLEHKTIYALVVSVMEKDVHWKPERGIEGLRNYFKNWEEVKMINVLSVNNDPHPRTMFSMLFKSKIERRNIDDIYTFPKNESVKIYKNDANFTISLLPNDLAERVSKSDDVDYKDTLYWKKRERVRIQKKSDKEMVDFIQGKIEMMKDIKKNGQRNPILIKDNNRIYDGWHRLSILKYLGSKSVIVRIV